MVKLVWISIVLAIICYFGYGLYEAHERREVEEAKRSEDHQERRRAENEAAQKVRSLIEIHEAVTDWEKAIENSRRILSFQLEQHWLGPRPILFVGTIHDIYSDRTGEYVVLIDRELFGISRAIFLTDIRLKLSAEKEIVEKLIDANYDSITERNRRNKVAVIASLDRVITEETLTSDGQSNEMRVGIGKLLEIVYIGSADLFET